MSDDQPYVISVTMWTDSTDRATIVGEFADTVASLHATPDALDEAATVERVTEEGVHVEFLAYEPGFPELPEPPSDLEVAARLIEEAIALLRRVKA